MINPKVDELSMMTYLSQFPNAKLKPGAPTRPRLNPNRVRAYGPGIEPKGNQVGAPARFTVETFSAGQGTLEVTVLNPKGGKEPVSIYIYRLMLSTLINYNGLFYLLFWVELGSVGLKLTHS